MLLLNKSFLGEQTKAKVKYSKCSVVKQPQKIVMISFNKDLFNYYQTMTH